MNLYIDDTSIRLLVFKGSTVTKWGDVQLESGLIQHNVITNEQRVAEEISQLLNNHDVKASKVNIGISGLGCLTRPALFPLLPKEVLGEAIEREAARVLPVPLEQLYLSWQVLPSLKENTEAFIVAIPRKIMEPLDRTLRLAGLKFQFLGLKPLLQASTVKEDTSVILDIQMNEFDIVVVSKGNPQPVRTMTFPADSVLWEDQLSLVADELERTISFFNTNSQGNPLSIDTPLFISGTIMEEDATCKILSERLGRPVKRLETPIGCPEDLDQTYYSVNLAMVYDQIRSKKEASPFAISVNVLPEAFHLKTVSLSNILPIPAAVIMLGALLFLFLMTQSISIENESLQTKINSTNLLLVQRQAEHQEIVTNIRGLQVSNDANLLVVNNFTETLKATKNMSTIINEYLHTITSGIKNSVTLNQINYSDEQWRIHGTAPNVRQISTYLKTIYKHDEYSDIESMRIVAEANEQMIFTLTTKLGIESISIKRIDTILSRVPNTFLITEFNYHEDEITMDGMANGEEELISFVNSLTESGLYSDIHILSVISDEPDGFVFSLVIKIGD